MNFGRLIKQIAKVCFIADSGSFGSTEWHIQNGKQVSTQKFEKFANFEKTDKFKFQP